MIRNIAKWSVYSLGLFSLLTAQSAGAGEIELLRSEDFSAHTIVEMTPSGRVRDVECKVMQDSQVAETGLYAVVTLDSMEFRNTGEIQSSGTSKLFCVVGGMPSSLALDKEDLHTTQQVALQEDRELLGTQFEILGGCQLGGHHHH